MDNKKTIKALQDGLAGYEKVVDKEVHYVYLKDNRYHELIFNPKKRNFMHLCGIEYYDPKTKRKVSKIKFYEMLKVKKIDVNGIKKNSFADLKLQVIDQLGELTKCNLRIIDEPTAYLNLHFTHAIRTRKKIFCLALESENSSNHLVPLSLLNLKKGVSIKSGHPVDCIYVVNKNTQKIEVLCKTNEFMQYELKHGPYPYKLEPETV